MDIAVLRIQAPDVLPSLQFASPTDGGLGSEVAAFGYPLESILGPSVTITRGVISAKRMEDGVRYLQTDAAVNPGNSGGPLVTLRGLVVGVVTARIEQVFDRPVQGIGLAIDIESVTARLNRLSRGAQYFRPTKLQDFYPAGTTPPVPPFPNIFRGTVTIDGQPAGDNVQVYARIGRYVSNPVAAKGGSYPYLTVQPPSEEGFNGKEIVFYVDGFPAAQRPIYQADKADPLVDLNLVATSQP